VTLFHIRLSDEHTAAIQKIAAKTGANPTTLIRMAVAHYVDTGPFAESVAVKKEEVK
jgi:predicted transcriptional regulator